MSDPRAYRKKPVWIQAAKWDGSAKDAAVIISWILNQGGTARYTGDEHCTGAHYIAIDTLEGRVVASPTDWVIRGVAGEFYPCRADIFEQTYELPGADDE